ncbi:MAG TPA: hypothetical protein PKV13_14200 [Propionicimonas sp.]|nr:hypothetical protein [Propionicimonas sp.]
MRTLVSPYFRARQLSRALGTVVVLGLVTAAVGSRRIPALPPGFGQEYVPVISLALMPVIVGVTCTTLLESPARTLERTSCRGLAAHRSLYALIICGLAIMLLLGAATLPEEKPYLLVATHFAAGTGLSLLITAWLSDTFAWLLVPTYALLSLMVWQAADSWRPILVFGPYPTQWSVAVCCALGALGVATHVTRRPRA